MYQNCFWARHCECNLEKHTSERKFQIIENSGILSFNMFNIYMKILPQNSLIVLIRHNINPVSRHFKDANGRFPFSQNFRNFRFGGKWNTFRRFVPLENSQKKWKI